MNKTTPWQRRRLTARTEDGKAVFACSGTPEKNAQAIQEVLDRLAEYEDLAAAGQLRFIPKPYGTKCATCANWEQIEGTLRGTCKVRAKCKSRYGRALDRPFEPCQSHAACREYERRDDNGQ